MGLVVVLLWALMVMTAPCARGEELGEKVRVAIFPLGGDAKEELRDRCGFSLRSKLDRVGPYEVIDGTKMAEVAAEAKEPIGAGTPAEQIKELGKLAEARVLIWGDLTNTADGATMRLKILDLREIEAQVRELSNVIKQPTDLRFVSEEILRALPGVPVFEHPNETAVQHDATAEELWKKNPDLLKNGDFSVASGWEGIYRSERYAVTVGQAMPATDKVAIYAIPEGGKTNNALAMNLSKDCAETNGLACLSAPIEISRDLRYRLSFRYRSDGPKLHVFVKGYTMAPNIKGEKVEREIYRRQVPPSGDTKGTWVTVEDELNPQHVAFGVQYLRIDLYAYLLPGTVMFDDVVLKAVGKQTREAKDEGLDKPTTRAAR